MSKTKGEGTNALIKIGAIILIIGVIFFLIKNFVIDLIVSLAAVAIDLFVVTNFYLFFSIIAFVSVIGMILVYMAWKKQNK